jgi:hypothetical protein
MTDSILKEYVGLMIEVLKLKEADITSGEKVPWGSEQHISDLENRIADLSIWRAKQPKGSASRANYSRVIEQLRSELRSAVKASQRTTNIPVVETYRPYDNLLSEELVSITRKGSSTPSLYDVTFRDEDDTISGKKSNLGFPPSFQAELDRNSKLKKLIQSVPVLEVMSFLDAVDEKKQVLFAPASNGASVAEQLNALISDPDWARTLDWSNVNKVGRGETTVHLAFKSESAPEPDFVGVGGLKLSIKNTYGSSKVRTGQSNKAIVGHINQLWDLLDTQPLERLIPSTFEPILLNIHSNKGGDYLSYVIEQCKIIFNNMKQSFVTEHGANGALFLINDQFHYVDPTNSSKLKIYMIEGHRISFFDHLNETSDSLDKVLQDLKKSVPAEQTRKIKVRKPKSQ